MKAGDDFSMFMNKAVPDRLRRRALRKLWLSNPLLANVDGLVDYGEDFTDRALAVENLQTAYQVGKGMLKHVAEVDQRDAGEDDADDVAEVAPTATPEPLASTVRVPEVAAQDHDHPVEGQGGEAIEIAEALPQPRRMQFTFEGDAA